MLCYLLLLKPASNFWVPSIFLYFALMLCCIELAEVLVEMCLEAFFVVSRACESIFRFIILDTEVGFEASAVQTHLAR